MMNRKIIFARLMANEPKLEDFQLVESPVTEPKDGELLLRNLYVSADPGSRDRLSGHDSYIPAKSVGEVMDAQSVSEVVVSKHPNYQQGDIVSGYQGWQDYAVSRGGMLSKIDPSIKPISASIGIFGIPGLTSYVGMRKILKVKSGETVLISSAAGAVGSVAGQIAKIEGARIVGIAGGEEKCTYAKKVFKFDDMIDYKSVSDIGAAISEVCPEGVDAFFDNVGGNILNAAVDNMKQFGRILICGQVAEYNLEPEQRIGLRDVLSFISKRLDMRGFVVLDHPKHFVEAVQTMADWIKLGQLVYKEHIVEGLENAPEAFCGLFRGENFGRCLVHIADPSS